MLFTRAVPVLFAVAVIGAQPMSAANDFHARVFQASGPVAVLPNQTASACATNLGSRPVKVLLAFLNAMTTPNPNNQPAGNQILAVREAALDPGQGVCFSRTGGDLATGKGVPGGGDIVAVVVEGGIFNGITDANGGIVQGGVITQNGVVVQGGILAVVVEGGIVASLQILDGNGTPVLYPNMALRTINPGPPGVR